MTREHLMPFGWVSVQFCLAGREAGAARRLQNFWAPGLGDAAYLAAQFRCRVVSFVLCMRNDYTRGWITAERVVGF